MGCYPLVENKEEQRNSKNRTRSTIITILITSVTKEVIKETLITKLIPEIKDNFPKDTRTIIIQLDGDSAHSVEEDPEIKRSILITTYLLSSEISLHRVRT